MTSTPQDAINELSELQKTQHLSIIELRDIFSDDPAPNGAKRNSDVSADAYDNATPASLEADLTHYKELFSKLRFSYIEQLTKEKFLAALTANPPILVEQQENTELEAQLLEEKAALKAQKAEVADIIQELEQRGRDLSRRYETVQLQTTRLNELPATIASLESTIATLRAALPDPNSSTAPHLSLPLPATLDLVAAREAELAALNMQLVNLQSAVPRKTRELERLEAELRPLELQKAGTVAAAKEARRRKEEGSGVDEMEERGRWLRSAEVGLRMLLGVES